jgi:hypothetical protein
MPRSKKSNLNVKIEAYEHRDKQRVNNPPVGLVTPDTDPDAGTKKTTLTTPISTRNWSGLARLSTLRSKCQPSRCTSTNA